VTKVVEQVYFSWK